MPVEGPDPTIASRARRLAPFRAAAPRALYLTVVLGALTTLSAWALASALPASRTATNVAPAVLSSDDGGAALFQLADLAPGKAESRCITVSYDGPGRADIRLVGSAAGSGLHEFLRLRVEAGSGGRFGDCSGFAGVPLFDGSLAEFVGRHHDYDSGLVALAPAQTGSTTFRLRMALDDVAAPQAGTATASFAWEARPGAPIAVAPLPAPPPAQPGGADADASPSPQRPAPDAEDRPARGTPDGGLPAPSTAPSPEAADPSGPAQPRRDASRPPGRTQRPAPSATAGESPRAARRSPTASDRGSGLVDAISKLVVPVVQRTAFPLILLIVAGLFLLVQDRIDRRDPKLARAPLHAQPDLSFLPPPSPGDVRP